MTPKTRAMVSEAKRLEKAGDHRTAMKALEMAVKSEPEKPEVWQALGDARIRSKEYAKAEKAYRRMARLQPEAWLPKYRLGATLKEMGQLDEAAVLLREALALKPSHAKTKEMLADIKKGRAAEHAPSQQPKGSSVRQTDPSNTTSANPKPLVKRQTVMELPATEEEFEDYEARARKKAKADRRAELHAEYFAWPVAGIFKLLMTIFIWALALGLIGSLIWMTVGKR